MIRLTESARGLLGALSIFVMGVVVGCGLDRTVLAPPPDAAAASVGRNTPRHHEEVLAELRAELGLSAEQSRRVEEIFKGHQGEIQEAWTQVHANLQRAMRQTTTEIESVLDSAQVERLHAWLAKRHGQGSGHGPSPEH